MIQVKNKKGNIVKIFVNTFENEAFEQVKKLANYEPYLDSKIRIMPDGHAGAGCVIGTTIQLTDKVTPNLVGVDIGCGMLCVRLSEKEIDFKKLDEVIRTYVPSGFDIHENPQIPFDFEGLICSKHIDLSRASRSIGSLGGGNHFIEVDYSEKDKCYYLVIHSGSRNLGVQVCKYYQDKAYESLKSASSIKEDVIKRLKAEHREKEINDALKKIKTPEVVKELAYLTRETGFFEYIHDMEITQAYAALNRSVMASIIIEHMGWHLTDLFHTIHNYIDTKKMILRKGAVSAQEGEKLIIPMNMREGSLICVGKGNPDWNFSAPHGAGRLMSRSKAKECISMDEFQASMSEVYTTSVCESTIDESPQAYKPTEEIMSLVTDTVDVVDIIKPVYNFKAN